MNELPEEKKYAEKVEFDKKAKDHKETMKENPQEKWDKIANQFETEADALGLGIDDGIKDAVVSLNVFEINTGQSCEGHTDNGSFSAPWIRIGAPNEPEERFVEQDVVFERIANKYNIPVEKAKRMFNMEAYWEAIRECSKNGETENFKKWKQECEKLLYVVKEILDDFYLHRDVPDGLKIRANADTIDDLPEGSFEIYNGGEDHQIIEEDLSQEEAEALKARLEGYRQEMKEFSEFLKEQYFSKGEIYIEEKRKIAVEKIEKKKIETLKKELDR